MGASARCCFCIPLPVAVYVLAPLTFCISLLLATLTTWYLVQFHPTISHVSTAILSVYVTFTILLSLSSILGLAGAIRRKAIWVKIYAELMCMNWFIGLGLGIGHIIKTWKNRKGLLKLCVDKMTKVAQAESGEAGDKLADMASAHEHACNRAFKWMNAFIIIAFIIVNLAFLYFIIAAFRAAKFMEREVPPVGEGYTYPPDTWNNGRNNSTGSNAGGGGGRQRSNTSRQGQIFPGPPATTRRSSDEKAAPGNVVSRSQSTASIAGVTSGPTRKASGYAPDDRFGSGYAPSHSRDKSGSVSSVETTTITAPHAGQTVPLGIGNGVYVSRYTSKGSIDAEASGQQWK